MFKILKIFYSQCSVFCIVAVVLVLHLALFFYRSYLSTNRSCSIKYSAVQCEILMTKLQKKLFFNFKI
jgi:hypothetical protein